MLLSLGCSFSYSCHSQGYCCLFFSKGEWEISSKMYYFFTASSWKCSFERVCLHIWYLSYLFFFKWFFYKIFVTSIFPFSYVNSKGWQQHFKSYCIPEDLVPRLLSPAYFHHYNAQPLNVSPETRGTNLLTKKREEGAEKPKEKDGEQLVLGLGPVQTSFWRLSKLVPLESVRRQVNKYREKYKATVGTFSASDSVSTALLEDDVVEPQSLEIEEGLDGISLKPISDSDSCPPANVKSAKKNGVGRNWRRVPYLPSYVPFGQVCFLICTYLFIYFPCFPLFFSLLLCTLFYFLIESFLYKKMLYIQTQLFLYCSFISWGILQLSHSLELNIQSWLRYEFLMLHLILFHIKTSIDYWFFTGS